MKKLFNLMIISSIAFSIVLITGCNGNDHDGTSDSDDVEKCATPEISPTSAKYFSEQTITITCATDGATIRYTIDNTDPSETAGIIIASGDSFMLDSTSTVKAIAHKTGMLTSTIASVDYTFQQWTWVSGDSTLNQSGVYGTQGISSASKKPGARCDSISWIDLWGNLWLFGGAADYDNDGFLSSYNDLWEFDPSTGEWTWVSGDNVVDQPGIYGSKGTGSTNNKPGAREGSMSWIDSSENFWLFGGIGYYGFGFKSQLNDLWKFEP